ncbi:hypothetical protein NDU88_007848 [Pleurodeles waltl]|uniref:Uncharacterized protein n=1 Tax=Pleurodeles waltl TaxID=8319 RepID=A0AAV7VRK9_PLEWA|nr:hypothetical protein NDU88_007848 [Pleurodeles waltl]
MVRNRGPRPTQLNNITKYAVSQMAMKETSGSSEPGPACSDPPQHTEPTVRDIMTAIQSVKDTLESKVDTVTLEVNIIKADLKKVTENLTVAESHISGLQSVTKRLEEQVQNLEDQEGRSRRNNFLIVEVPELVEGHSVDLFVEVVVINKRDSLTIANVFADYYEEQYQTATHMGEAERTELLSDIGLNELEEESRVALGEDLMVEDITQAMQGLQSGKPWARMVYP